MPARSEFSGLSEDERDALAVWRATAEPQDIDTVIDLTGRDWNLPGARAVIGIFRKGREQAAWALVGEASGWSVIDCVSGTIMGGADTLVDALGLIVTD